MKQHVHYVAEEGRVFAWFIERNKSTNWCLNSEICNVIEDTMDEDIPIKSIELNFISKNNNVELLQVKKTLDYFTGEYVKI